MRPRLDRNRWADSTTGGMGRYIWIYINLYLPFRLDMVRCPRYHHAMEIARVEYDALLAQYAAAQALIDEALVACEQGMVRTAAQKGLHVVQNIAKIDAELVRLKIAV
jgi:hypothetical protein